MKRVIFNSELSFSQFSQGFWRLGEWNFSEDETINFIRQIFEFGITTFDHADIYGDYLNEERFGVAFSKSGIRRENVELVTKCGIKLLSAQRYENKFHSYDTSKKHIIQSAEKSLRNLRTDYIDVLLIHRPDFLMNADEISEAFYELRKSGKVREFGVSNFNSPEFSLLQSRLDFKLVTNQIEFSLLNMEHIENGNFYYLQEQSVVPMIWSPLAGGRLINENSEEAIRIRNVLFELQNKYQTKSISAIALAWILLHPTKPNIVLGSGKINRIKEAIEAMNIELERDDWFKLWTAAKGREIP